jgi:hypothetical protein
MNPHFARGSGLAFAFTAIAIASGGSERSAIAQDPARPAAKEDDRPKRLQSMRNLAQKMKVSMFADGRPLEPISLCADPWARYNDPPRGIHDATLWAWGDRGRPRAVLKVEQMPDQVDAQRWVVGLVSLASERIAVSFDDGAEWTSRRSGLAMRPIPRSPAPAVSEAVRLGQMRDLARRFSASEYNGPARGRLQLRLMPKPFHRYADPDAGISDGAIFAFAYGTNPDVLLVIEATGAKGAPSTWRYDLARLGGAEASVTLDSQEVWRQPYADPPSARETYMNRWLAAGEDSR